MEKLNMCRVCLVESVRMYIVTDLKLQETYERLTQIPFITADSRPLLACFFCYARLKQCCLFMMKCLEAEKVFTQIINNDYEQKPLKCHKQYYCGGFIRTSTENINIVDGEPNVISVKEELPDDSMTDYNVCAEKEDETEVINNINTVDKQQFYTELQNYYSLHNENSKKIEWTNERIKTIIQLINEFKLAKMQGKRPGNKQYHYGNKYDVIASDHGKILIKKRKKKTDPIIQIIPSEDYYKKLLYIHIATRHGRRETIYYALRNKYVIPIFAINIFLKLCKTCISKYLPRSKVAVKPVVLEDSNRRGQIDLIDFQSLPDKDYKWLLQYHDHWSNSYFLRPLKTNEANEIAVQLLKIFLEAGCPDVLESNNGIKFTISVLKEILILWPTCKIIISRPTEQSQDSIASSNEDVKRSIQAWMVDHNSSSWSSGCYYAQTKKNFSYDPTSVAHETMPKDGFVHPNLDLSTSFTLNVITKLQTEELKKIYNIQNSEINTTDANEEEKSHETDNQTNYIKTIMEEMDIPICNICSKDAPGAQTCIKCNRFTHAVCGTVNEDEINDPQLICNFCLKEKKRKQERIEVHTKKRTANPITVIPSKKIKENDTTVLEVLKENRGVKGNNLDGKAKKLCQVGTSILEELLKEDEGIKNNNLDGKAKKLCQVGTCDLEKVRKEDRKLEDNNLDGNVKKICQVGTSVLEELPKEDKGIKNNNLDGNDKNTCQVGTSVLEKLPKEDIGIKNNNLDGNVKKKCQVGTSVLEELPKEDKGIKNNHLDGNVKKICQVGTSVLEELPKEDKGIKNHNLDGKAKKLCQVGTCDLEKVRKEDRKLDDNNLDGNVKKICQVGTSVLEELPKEDKGIKNNNLDENVKKKCHVGTSVLEELPKEDKGLKNNNLYGKAEKNCQIDTPFDVLNDWIKNDHSYTNRTLYTFKNREVTLRTTSSPIPNIIFRGRCGCKIFNDKGQCLSSRCTCRRAKVSCTTRCHKPVTCNNS